MTDKEIAFKIAAAFRRFQARQTAYQVYLNRLPVDVQATEKSIDWDVNADLSPQGPYGPALHSFARELESANPHEVLGLLYRELFDPSAVTLKPATCGHFKTGHFGWPET